MNIELRNKNADGLQAGTMENLKARIIAETRACYDLFNEKMNRSYPYPEIAFDLRGTCAGQAFPSQNRIRYNLQMAYYNESAFMGDTIFHEASHVLACLYFGCRPAHDHNWRYVMRHVFGKEPNRCHSFDVEKCIVRRTYIYKYRCGCSDACFTGAKHHKLIQLGATVSCRRCRVKLTPLNFIAKLDKRLKV